MTYFKHFCMTLVSYTYELFCMLFLKKKKKKMYKKKIGPEGGGSIS